MIQVRNLAKTYRTRSGLHTVFRNLSFEVPTGLGLAVLGRNGAGKTTLVNILGGAEKPDSGQVFCNSTISWPVGLAGGFQPGLSARDNVKFVARLYGGGAGIAHVVEFVREFAEIGKYFEMPVHTYSSGMQSRVSFGLSMAFEFDYYLIDEVTSVGDPSFQKKCNYALEEKRNNGSGFIVVSHQMDIVRRFCTAGILLSSAGARYFCDIEEAIAAYQDNG